MAGLAEKTRVIDNTEVQLCNEKEGLSPNSNWRRGHRGTAAIPFRRNELTGEQPT
jgi:hypothetical protein